MKKVLLHSRQVVFPEAVREAEILIADGKIESIGSAGKFDEKIDAAGHFVLPALIDIHYHGLFMFPDPDKVEPALERMKIMLARRGVGGFLATFPAMPLAPLCECLSALKQAAEKQAGLGANLLGVHLEGPFLSKDARGAQPENAIIEFDPDSREMMRVFEAGEGLVKIMTVAPEQKFAGELLKVLAPKKIIASLGHSAIGYDRAMEFAKLGAQGITHIFNGMSGIHHRNPGLALAGLDEHFYKEVIVDGFHLHPAVVNLVWKNAPRGKFILISDFVGDEEPLDFEPPRLNATTFAGSRLRLLRAVRNLVKFTGASLPDAVAAASLWPAEILGRDDLGGIRPGADADLILADHNLSLKAVISRGVLLEHVKDV
jgi:N-acetylglucosamine-6-phosphate deacetylase